MILRFLKAIIKLSFKIVIRTIGFVTAVALGPGMMLLIYLYDLDKPSLALIEDLPEDPAIATQVLQGRTENIFGEGLSSGDFQAALSEMGFEVSEGDRNAVLERRRLDCIKSYSLIWTEKQGYVQRVAALYGERCPGIAKS